MFNTVKQWLYKAIFCIIPLIPTQAFASSNACPDYSNDSSIDTTVIFINGIANTKDDACFSSLMLRASLSLEGVDVKKLNWTHIYNKTDWNVRGVSLADIDELRVQATFSDDALKYRPATDTEYYKLLGAKYESLKHLVGKNPLLTPSSLPEIIRVVNTTYAILNYIKSKTSNGYVILVPHSQGNAYVEAVFAILTYEGNFDALNRIRVVGVAPVSARPPRAKYLRHNADTAINFFQADVNTIALSHYKPAAPNAIACLKEPCTDTAGSSLEQLRALTKDSNLHSFTDVYLNPAIVDGSVGYVKEWSFRYEISTMVKEEIAAIASIRSLSNPTANISLITPKPTAGNEVIFKAEVTATPNGAVTEFEWDFGDGTVQMQTGSEMFHTYTSGGTYTVKLKIKDVKGVTNTTSKEITVAGVAIAPTIITTPLYERHTGDAGEACYSRQIGTAKSTDVYSISNTTYCLRGGQWVDATGVDNGQYLDSQGNLYPFSSVEAKHTGNNTYTAGFGGSTMWNTTITRKSAGVYSQSVKSVVDIYKVYFNPNSYIYKNVGTLNLLIGQYNRGITNTGYMSSGGNIGFLFSGQSVTSGTVIYFNINDPNRNIVDTGTWSKKSFGSNTQIIELDEKSSLLYGGESIQQIYYKNSSESGVRDGYKSVAGRTNTMEVFDRTTFNAMLARDGLPATPN